MKIELTAEELKAIQLSLEMRVDWLEEHRKDADTTGYWNLIEKIHEARNPKEVER